MLEEGMDPNDDFDPVDPDDDPWVREFNDWIAATSGQPLVDWDAMPPVRTWDANTVVIYRS